MIKSNKDGITLVALVVTIIVLLLLFGITINELMGNSGFISKIRESKASENLAQQEGQNQIDNLESQNLDTGNGVVEEHTNSFNMNNTIVGQNFIKVNVNILYCNQNITSIKYTLSKNDNTNYSELVNDELNPIATSYTFPNLESGVVYYYKVIIYNNDNEITRMESHVTTTTL